MFYVLFVFLDEKQYFVLVDDAHIRFWYAYSRHK